jgi:phosphatidylserine synthase
MSDPEKTSGPRSPLWFASDPPNLASLAGLLAAVLGIYFAIRGVFPAAMIGLVWAVAFDWLDGRIARGMKGRTPEQREFGGHLDSLIDVVSFGVAPAVLLLSVGGFGPWFLPGAAVVLGTAVVRLSYFNVFGLVEGSTYRGLALDNNAMIIVLLFAFQSTIGAPVFAPLLYGVLMVLCLLNVAPIRTPKLGGTWFYGVLGYAVAATALYGWQLLAVVR